MNAEKVSDADVRAAWEMPYPRTRHDIWTRTNVGEVFPNAVTPLTWSLYFAIGEATMFLDRDRFWMIPPALYSDGKPPLMISAINGRLFFNTGLVYYIATEVLGLPSSFYALTLGGPQEGERLGLPSRPARPLRILRSAPSLFKEQARVEGVVRQFHRSAGAMRAEVKRLRREDLSALELPDLLARLDRITRAAGAPYGQLFDGTSAALNSYGVLAELCDRWLGDRSLANDLVTGLATMLTAQASVALWNVARAASESPRARSIITEAPPADVPRLLHAAPETASVAEALDRFTANHGHRSANEFELAVPTWQEDPTFVVNTLRAYLDAPPDSDPSRHLARQRERRRAAERSARERLRPRALGLLIPWRWPVFRSVLRRAQRFLPMRENPKYHFLLYSAEMRGTALAIAAGLARRGQIELPDDVFFLSRAELGGVADQPGCDLRPLVRARRELYARFSAWQPAEVIRAADVPALEAAIMTVQPSSDVMEPPGAQQPPRNNNSLEATSPPSALNQGSISSVTDRRRGELHQDHYASTGSAATDSREMDCSPDGAAGGRLVGIAASSGCVTGTARVARSPEEGAALQPGEILVAPFTDPGWTPLFTVAGAIVMDLGGLLSHGAIVAREYGIPAVVNTRTATSMVRTGQQVTVDGDSGVVSW